MAGDNRFVRQQGKVLFVATVYTHLAAFHLPFIRLLQGWGYEVHAAASPAEGRKEEVAAAGVTCHDLPFARSVTSLRNWRAYRRLRSLLRKERYDLIHVHTPVAAWLTRLAAKRTGQGPVLYTAHGFHFFRGAPWHYWLLFYGAERIAARWTDGLIVVNGEDFARAQRMGFEPGKNLFLVHGVGVDLSRYGEAQASREEVRAALGLPSRGLVVTCVAEFTPTKNHAQLLAAWPKVARTVPTAHLLLVGDGRLRGKLEEGAKRASLSRVRFLGFRCDVPQILAGSDVFVLPSRREGLPRSVLEAMATGLPVVATDVRGNRDLVEDGVNGFLVQVGDVDGLAHALLRLLGDQDLRKRMGQAGREKAQAYSLARVLEEMAAVYRRYLPRTGAGARRGVCRDPGGAGYPWAASRGGEPAA